MEPSIQEPYLGLSMSIWVKVGDKILQYNYGTKSYSSHSTLYFYEFY